MERYGFIENGYLRSFDIVPYTTTVKDSNGKYITKIVTVEEQKAQAMEKGWKPIEDIEEEKLHCEDGMKVVIKAIEKEDCITFDYQVVKDTSFYKRKIEELKAELSKSDYKVIKCYEASLTGNEQPYDINEVHKERQSIRDEINELEKNL